jgi:hypothetical protein
MTSIIIVQHDAMHLTREAIASFCRHHSSGYELILVDNGSTGAGLDELMHEFPAVKVLSLKSDRGYGFANNRGAELAGGDLLFFLNNDTLFTAPVLPVVERMFTEDPGLGVAGPRLVNTDLSFQLSAGWLPSFWREIADKVIYGFVDRRNRIAVSATERVFRRVRNVGWVTGAALFIRTDLFRSLGGFDEKMTMYFEDKDICLRAGAAGMHVRYTPEASLVHIRGGSSAAGKKLAEMLYRRSQVYYYLKHRPRSESHLLYLYLKISGKLPGRP